MRLPPAPFVYPILDAARLGGRPASGVAHALVAAGARLLQVRAKGLGSRAFCDLVAEVVGVARAGGALVIVNDRPDVALVAGADGVHVGQDDMPVAEVRRLMPRPFIVGLSTHGQSQVRAESLDALDYVAIGPVYATTTKAAPGPVVGVEGVAAARQATDLPLVAIGGITGRNVAGVIGAGADGIAVVSALLDAPDAGAALRAMRTAITRGE